MSATCAKKNSIRIVICNETTGLYNTREVIKTFKI